MEDTYRYALSREGLFFLSELLGCGQPLGWQDPFQGFLAAEIEERWIHSRKELIDHGLLSDGPSGSIEVDPLAGACVAVCGSGHALHIRKAQKGRAVYEGWLHLTPALVVERCESDEQPGRLQLSPIANLELALGEVERIFPAASRGQGKEAVSFVMTSDVWRQLEQLGQEKASPGPVCEMLAGQGCSEHWAASLADAWLYPEERIEAAVLTREGRVVRSRRLVCLRGAAAAWLLTEQNSGTWQVCTYDGEQVRRFLDGIAEQVQQQDEEAEGGTDHGTNYDPARAAGGDLPPV
ncbi:hypothetical protein [Paenibacillus mucilaginosus]|nr:hypothetical protein [Paenibacillus mucilaginosus]MCG7215157.1 hypothetical protein [Paenibacillus mucilaginosus]WDM27046.1 hypothetical protein KCX80_32375 [Paenibacillus mucilaginosus]